MPWCDTCSLYHAHEALDDEGRCPSCGESVSESKDAVAAEETTVEETGRVGDSAPWHFWIVVAALVAYIGWRIIVGIGWLIERI